MFLPVSATANTLQPGQNFNNENTEEQNDSINDEQEQQQNDYSEPSGENGWTETESYDNNNNWNNDNDNYDNNENYYNNEGGNWGPQQEPAENYEEPVQEEPVIEEPVEPEPEPEYEEPVIEEPVEEVPVMEEPVEVVEPEPTVDVNTLDTEAFSISGEAVDEDGEGIEGNELILSGESFDEQSVVTDKDGNFLFEEVPSGNYQIEIKPAEGYEIKKSTLDVEVSDRSKRGLIIILNEAEEEAAEEDSVPVEPNEDVMAAETGSLSSMDWTLIGTGIVFALISLFVLLFKKVRNN